MTDKVKLIKVFNDLGIPYHEMKRTIPSKEGEIVTKCICIGNPEKEHVTFNFDLSTGEYLSLNVQI